MKALQIIAGALAVLVMLPIGLYLQFQILKRVDATELMWFLFWVNVPFLVFVQLVSKIAEKAK